MLKATYIKNATSPIYDRWHIYFHDTQSKEWDGDFVGSVYRSSELQQLGYLDSYEFYYCDPTTFEIVHMLFRNQKELMKFLAGIGKAFRARYNLGS